METPLTPLEFARRSRALYGEREAVVDGPRRFTYRQFFERCDRWSAALQGLGVARGDRVAYIAPNTHSHLESFYGVPQIGAVLVPINYRLSGEEFAYIINHSGATVVCAHEDYLECVDGLRPQLKNVRHFVALEGRLRSEDASASQGGVRGDGASASSGTDRADASSAGEGRGRAEGASASQGRARAEGVSAGSDSGAWLDYETLLADAPAAFTPTSVNETDLLTINYTSGTTSRPKGVMITHRNAYMNAIGTLVHLPMTVADRYLWTLPMFHANGWTFPWIVTAVGGTHVCLRRVEVPKVFELLTAERITLLCAAPTVLISIANAPPAMRAAAPRGVRVITAGAPPAAATIERVEGEFGWTILQVYGLTETAPFITVCEPRPEHAAMSSTERGIVKARQGVELITSGQLRVVDANDRDVPRDGQTVGEIIVRGNVVMKGYYNDPDATAVAMRGGFFRSGDAAVVHPDGYVDIRDRIKDVIISGGENISSVEVEGVLLRHPAVQEAGVVGLPDEKWGEAPHAFIVLKPEQTVPAEELRAFVRERLAHFKCPHSFNFVAELPKTATGKIQKFVLRGRRSAISTQ
jgi:fatty-acyl-CoA synthase